MYVCAVFHVCALSPPKSEEGFSFPGDSRELPCGCWDMNLGPLPLTSELSLHPLCPRILDKAFVNTWQLNSISRCLSAPEVD